MLRSLLDYVLYKIKKQRKNMDFQTKEVVDRKMNMLKKEYFGKMYSWIRPINGEDVNEPVRVTDVKYKEDEKKFMLIFNSGTPVSINETGLYLKPYAGPDIAPPGQLSEMGISQTGASPIQIPDELKEFETKRQPEQAQFPMEQPAQKQIKQPVIAQQKSGMFDMFNATEKVMEFPIKVKMPDISLVKMMYGNAADKDAFLRDFAQYLMQGITPEAVADAASHLLGKNDAQLKINFE